MLITSSIPTEINDRLSDRYKVLLIIFLSLGIYYPSIFGVINSVDDADMVNHLMNMESINLKGLFLPGDSLKYYRPVLYLTFVLDRFLWLCDETFMHLENIILHTLNGLLVFFIARSIIERFNIRTNPYTPLFTSLLYLLTPLNTEAVNWISGRTDLMAGTFVFLSFYLFIKKGIESFLWCWISAFVYLLGLLSKEVSISLLPVVALFLFFLKTETFEINWNRGLRLISPFFFMTVVYVMMRQIATGFSDIGLLTLSEATKDSSVFTKLGSAIKAFGFYIKKLFIPLPLNFAIVEINRLFYFWFGLIMIIVTLYLIRRRDIYTFFSLFSILFFLPAIPVAISKMAWTPLAERYLYISSFGASFIIVHLVYRLPLKNISTSLLSILLIIAATITVQRNFVWQSNLCLFEDTAKKSPRFAAVRNELGIAYAKDGKLEKAKEQFIIAMRLGGEKYWIPSLNLIEHEKMGNNTISEAKKNYIKLLSRADISKHDILSRIIALTEAEIMKEKDINKVNLLLQEEINYLEQLTAISKSGFYFYRLGQLYLNDGKKEKAKEYFKKAATIEPNAYFAPAAMKLSEKIEAGKI